MKIVLNVTDGPHRGKEFTFEGHDTFLVGRDDEAHLSLSDDDPYFSRRHFVLEVNPPRCRLMDLKSRNGTQLNGQKVQVGDVKDGDVIQAGHTKFEVRILPEPGNRPVTLPNMDTVQQVQLPDPRTLHPKIPGYQIEKELGRGGMGVVYQGKRITDGQMVAIKTIIPALGASDKQIDRFLREAKALKELNHRNIIGFEDVGESEAIIFLVMELVTGPDLSQILQKKGLLPIDQAVRAICQMLSGLSHAHQKGYVHRDIKPANILLHTESQKSIAKLADFGLARIYEASQLSGLTMQGEVGGTLAFIAPEQITHFRSVQPPADQYSSGATLYTLLTNRYIHDLPTSGPEALIHICTEEPIPIGNRRSDLPKALADTIHISLKREPKDRFRDVKEFRSELLKWA